MDKLKQKAFILGATEFGISNTKNKRLYVVYKGRRINFGLKGGSTFIDHRDEKKRKAWRARHSKIRNKEGRLVHKLKTSPDYWAWHILW